MKWTKLEYGQWPEGEIVIRLDAKKDTDYLIGYIDRNSKTGDWMLYCRGTLPSKISIDSIYDLEPHYISLDAIEMPEVENEQP